MLVHFGKKSTQQWPWSASSNPGMKTEGDAIEAAQQCGAGLRLAEMSPCAEWW
jgi:hypothetical protein